MAFYTQNIGKTMAHGFAGEYGRQPDMIVSTLPAGGAITFGAPVKISSGKVVAMGAGDAASDFVGIAAAEVKSALNFADQSEGAYAENDAVAIFERGCINVKCQKGTAALGGTVYVRIAANSSYPTAVVGGIEAEADGSNTVALTNCAFAGSADSNGIVELRIKTIA